MILNKGRLQGIELMILPKHNQIYQDTEPGQTAGNRTHDTA